VKKLIASMLCRLYRVGLYLNQASYYAFPFRIKRVNARVISVGNLTWGGTGKTPLTIKLAKDLAYYGKRVVVLTRGYSQDEVEELKKRLGNIPVLVGRDRIKSAKEAVNKYKAEVIVLDDGFQHIRLHRDMDIVTINTVSPFGSGQLIPAGNLREPISHLSRAHLFVLTKSNIGAKNMPMIRQKVSAAKPNAQFFEAIHKPIQFSDRQRNRFLPLQDMRGKKIAALSGIGDPHSFEKTVEMLGAEIVFAGRFDDHHCFTKKDILDFIRQSKEIGAQEVITTEKDYFRLEPVLKTMDPKEVHYNFLVMEIEFQVNDEEDFIRRCVNS
jgi:tetraacyldisaccharide-1-P 4'-kinase